MSSSGAPCGACKFLRRKCVRGCIFAPYFGAEQGAARFAAVHKIFGASNVGKLLLHIPLGKRCDAVLTISYEAQARLSDPVYGCVATIFALQQQVASLQAELAIVQAQLASRLAVAALQQQQQQHQQHGGGGAGGSSSMPYVEQGSMTPGGVTAGMSMAGSSSVGSYANRIKEESYHHGMHCYDPGHHHGVHLDQMTSSPPDDMEPQDLHKRGSDSMDPQQSGATGGGGGGGGGGDMGDLQILAQALLSSRK
ncbi:protein MpASLBD2 [Marchantia polymorpha subsp. ruderalis]|uniref:LOB domain-containing protein n=1 Tax=Marchantia polymorpha TaxID=3197 RepID=A0A2R6XMD7_MARPO|nr:hypothetical protein MARPO_0008s0060 [Marchantia polymorpha]BBN19543.1 hypothetical protein Mp_8g11560 [Marchantia polymorpha subsp. ruderalis]|eukprot:PTQ47281.1 hypothetical protein MARPO_0008s0060 [Marchantia polymorpha]